MLDRTQKKFKSYFDAEPQRCSDGQYRQIDTVTRVDMHELDRLISVFRSVKPDASIETGLAYGFSTIAILDCIEEINHGFHMAIDPRQVETWHGIGITSIKDLGFDHNFEWIKDQSDQAFARLIRDKRRIQFVFLDGIQYFDGILTDFCLASQVLDVGGVIVFNQLWMPGGRAAKSFIDNNMPHYKTFPVESNQLFAYQKTGAESRPWDHFLPFDGSGGRDGERQAKPSLLRKLFG